MHTETGDRENGTVPKRPQPAIAVTDCDVVHRVTAGNRQWVFDPRLADVIISHVLPFGGTRHSVLTNIDCMCWAGKNGRT